MGGIRHGSMSISLQYRLIQLLNSYEKLLGSESTSTTAHYLITTCSSGSMHAFLFLAIIVCRQIATLRYTNTSEMVTNTDV